VLKADSKAGAGEADESATAAATATDEQPPKVTHTILVTAKYTTAHHGTHNFKCHSEQPISTPYRH
jgi:hypothetical protein